MESIQAKQTNGKIATAAIATTNNKDTASTLAFHPNGKPVKEDLKRPLRNDDPLYANVFPDTYIGRLLRGLVIVFLSKQEHRFGWARKSACDDIVLMEHPNETVAAHQWGVAMLVMTIAREPKFQEELPNFNILKAMEMAVLHDVAEVKIGDITPVDGISPEEKHKAESEAMDQILGCFPKQVGASLRGIYEAYENRECIESKFVKDCDRLDFMIQAFILERQGFSGFSEFYHNTVNAGFSTKIASELAEMLTLTRNELCKKNLLYNKSC